jgi:hypothetical protein
MTIFVPILLLVVLVTVVLLGRCAYLLIKGLGSKARKNALMLAAILGAYAVALIGMGLASQKETLALGQIKCFDDWCVQLNSASRQSNQVSIRLDTVNHARRAEAPDSPHAFIVVDGQTIPVQVPKLTDRIEGGSTNPIDVTVTVPASAQSVGFLVTEGGMPSGLVIDDENSPFHAKSVWALGNLTRP